MVDPDSPAGAEYAIPLDQARREAAGGEAGSPGGEGGAGVRRERLFGVGIEHASGPDSTRGRGAPERGGGGDSSGSPSAAGRSRSTASVAGPPDRGSGWQATLAIAGAVLTVGVAAGLALRRLLRQE